MNESEEKDEMLVFIVAEVDGGSPVPWGVAGTWDFSARLFGLAACWGHTCYTLQYSSLYCSKLDYKTTSVFY